MIPKPSKIYNSILFLLSTVSIFFYLPKKADMSYEILLMFVIYLLFSLAIRRYSRIRIVIAKINLNIVLHKDVLLLILTGPFLHFVYRIIIDTIDAMMEKDEKLNDKIFYVMYNISSFNFSGIAAYMAYQALSNHSTHDTINVHLILLILLVNLIYGIVNKVLIIPNLYFTNDYKNFNFIKFTLLVTLFRIILLTPMFSLIIYLLGKKEYLGAILVLILDTFIIIMNQKSNEITKTSLEAEVYKKIAYKDQLTDVYNRHYFTTMIQEKKLLHEDIGIALMDIDYFKKINDTFNHEVGDQVLKHFAKLIKEQLQENDILIRMGGEEFLILFKNKSFEECIHFMEQLRVQIQNEQTKVQFNDKETTIHFTMSTGLYYKSKENMISIEKAVNNADNLLYESKKSGRNKITHINK